ncbi:CAP domain-containing protein [Anaeromicrobium sediminis]|uniref:SCP domain-containing protein n=1 Tax=Anaeromicrobium sediminis TaxID=1478221 RepID=A0A267MGF7_9FIRM|nr:CAP domain-containing protein [Anaeromicrobium sediminis]PAB58659.1 hypothetical protein CCE28_14355 [Anaeromicrobium sediminis]
MRKFFLILISLSLLISCNTKEKAQLKPMTSSIFNKGKIEKVKIVKESDLKKNLSLSFLNTPSKDNIYNVVGETKDYYLVELDKYNLGIIDKSSAEAHIENTVLDQESYKATPNEDEMLRYINGERIKRGLTPLKVDKNSIKVARLKSQDMIDNNYFSHYSPTYGSPFNMLNKFNIKYITAGENIGYNTSVKKTHEALMESKEHKESILNKYYTHVGIGIKEMPKGGKMITEIFIQK